MSLLLAVAAMEMEAELLLPRLSPAGRVGGRPLYRGRLAGRELALLLTGLGQVNTAQALAAVLERLTEVMAVVNLGCAGAYAGSGLALGEPALATEVIFADLGVVSGGRLHGLEKTGIPLARDAQGRPIFNRLVCDPALSDELAAANPGIARGDFATVEHISGDPRTAADVERRWGALLEEMESAAAALVSLHYGKPFAALRGVSNRAGERELDVAAGARAAQRALLNLEA